MSVWLSKKSNEEIASHSQPGRCGNMQQWSSTFWNKCCRPTVNGTDWNSNMLTPNHQPYILRQPWHILKRDQSCFTMDKDAVQSALLWQVLKWLCWRLPDIIILGIEGWICILKDKCNYFTFLKKPLKSLIKYI